MDIYLWYPKKGLIPNKKIGMFSSYGSMGAGFETQNAKYIGNYLKDTLEHYSLEITKFDKVNKIISGRFECTLRNIGSEIDTAKIKITNGVFDARY